MGQTVASMSSLKKLVERTCTPDTPCQLVEVEGLKELIQYIRKASGKEAAILSVLKELKPYIKSDFPKPILAGLKVIEMLMIQIGKPFCEAVSSEEWTRRLRKLATKTKEPILKMTVLQHLADWVEMFGMIADISYLNRVNNELVKEYGIQMPGPSANAREHSNRLRAAEEKKVEASKPQPEPEPEPEPAQNDSDAAEADTDDSDDEVYVQSDDDGEEEIDLGKDASAEANAILTKLRAAAHELRALRVVHRSSSGKLKRRLARKTERLETLESRIEDPDKVEYMRKVNRELADAQRQLLNLQYTWTTMESEVQELGWQSEKAKEEFVAIEKQNKKLTAETSQRRADEKETYDELAESEKELKEAKASTNYHFGENLEEVTSIEELEEIKATITKTLAAL